MDKKRAKIKKDEYLKRLDDETKDLPMSKESSPEVEVQELSCGGMGKAVRGGKYIGCK